MVSKIKCKASLFNSCLSKIARSKNGRPISFGKRSLKSWTNGIDRSIWESLIKCSAMEQRHCGLWQHSRQIRENVNVSRSLFVNVNSRT